MNKYEQYGLPWSHGLGKDVTMCNTAQEVMQKAGLNWTVKKCEVVAKIPFTIGGDNRITEQDELNGDFARDGKIYRTLPDAYATYRTDKNIPLGFVKSKYEVIQNMDAFNFFDDAIGIDHCQWESAGSFGYGHKIFVTAKIALTTEVSNGISKDPIENYLVFSNSHDGTSSITVMFTPIRVFCTNCLNSGLDKSDSYIRIRHTVSAKDRLDQGSRILRIACEKAERAKELYNALYTITMRDEEVLQYLANLNLTDNERENLLTYGGKLGYKRLIERDYMTLEATGISTRKANIIRSMYEYYQEGIGQDRIIGTAWGAYNAVTGYYSNVIDLNREKRMESLLYGNAQNSMQKGLISLYDEIKAA